VSEVGFSFLRLLLQRKVGCIFMGMMFQLHSRLYVWEKMRFTLLALLSSSSMLKIVYFSLMLHLCFNVSVLKMVRSSLMPRLCSSVSVLTMLRLCSSVCMKGMMMRSSSSVWEMMRFILLQLRSNVCMKGMMMRSSVSVWELMDFALMFLLRSSVNVWKLMNFQFVILRFLLPPPDLPCRLWIGQRIWNRGRHGSYSR
jgi:hypothetical protein